MRRQAKACATGEAGVTLLELLLAVSLVALLSVGMLFALHVGLNTMYAANRRVAVNRRTTGAERIIEQQIGGFIPVYANCLAPGNPGGEKTPFFHGAEDSAQFVTGYSLNEAQRGLPRVVQIFVGPGADGVGVRLLENEYPYNGPFGAGQFCLPPEPDPITGEPMALFRRPESQAGTFVVADKLSFVRFRYLEGTPMGEKPDMWIPRWRHQNLWPRAIGIEIAPLEQDPSRVQPVTLVMSLHITRDAREGLLRK